jgi:hypothetical protein
MGMQERFDAPLTYYLYPGQYGETSDRMSDIAGRRRGH